MYSVAGVAYISSTPVMIYHCNAAVLCSPGNPEPNDPSYLPGVDWRAYVYASIDNGFLLAEPTQDALRFQYVRSKDRTVIDTFTITRSWCDFTL